MFTGYHAPHRGVQRHDVASGEVKVLDTSSTHLGLTACSSARSRSEKSMKLRPPIAGHTSMELLRTGSCADSLWTLLTEQGVRFPRNPCIPLRRFTWHPLWPYVP